MEKDKTRKITSLINDNTEVWFYIEDEYMQLFFNELCEIGARFLNGEEITKDSIKTMMGVSRDKTVGYVSNLVWYNTFFTENPAIKVFYGKYKEGSEDYIIKEPNIVPLNQAEI